MRFLFIFAGPNKVGGIETLIARMSHWLIEHGHEVSLITNEFSHCRSFMPEEMKVIELSEDFEKLYLRRGVRAIWKKTGLRTPDIIKTFDIPGAWIASVLAAETDPMTRTLAGIYNPRFLNGPNEGLRNLRPRLWEAHFIQHVPHKSRLFMADEQIQAMKRLYGNLEEGRLFLLPVDASRYSNAKRMPKWGKIVSVGRLEHMKEYNLYMIRVIHDLKERGYDVQWVVYGNGSYKDSMQKAVDEAGLASCIHIAGELPYSKFAFSMEDAYVFVGMGTAVIEASFCRVPNVVAIAFDREGKTLGPIYQFIPGNTGEPSSNGDWKRVESEIEKILLMNESEYLAESERVFDYVQIYSIDKCMNKFLDYCKDAPYPHLSSWHQFLYNFTYYWIRLRKFIWQR